MKRYVFIVGLLLALLAPPGRSGDISQQIRDGGVIDAQNGDRIDDTSVSSAEGVVLNIKNSAVTGTATSVSMNSSTIDIDGSGSSLTLSDATLTINNGSLSIKDAGDNALSVKDLVISGADFGINNSAATASEKIILRTGVVARLNPDGTAPGTAAKVQGKSISMDNSSFYMGDNSEVAVTGGATDGFISLSNHSNFETTSGNQYRYNADGNHNEKSKTSALVRLADGANFTLDSSSQILLKNGDLSIAGNNNNLSFNGTLYFYSMNANGAALNQEQNVSNLNILGVNRTGLSPTQPNYSGFGNTGITGSLGSSTRIQFDGSFVQSLVAEKFRIKDATGLDDAAAEEQYRKHLLSNATILINYSGSGENYTSHASTTQQDANGNPTVTTTGDATYGPEKQFQHNNTNYQYNGANSNGEGLYYIDKTLVSHTPTPTGYTTGDLQYPSELILTAPDSTRDGTTPMMDYSGYLGGGVNWYTNGELNEIIDGKTYKSKHYTGPSHQSAEKTYHTMLGKFTITTGNNLRSEEASKYYYYHTYTTQYTHNHSTSSGYTSVTHNVLRRHYVYYNEDGSVTEIIRDWDQHDTSDPYTQAELNNPSDSSGSFFYTWGNANDLYVYKLEDEVDFSMRTDPVTNFNHFKNNVDYHFPLRTISPGYLEALFETAAYNASLQLDKWDPSTKPNPNLTEQKDLLNPEYEWRRLAPNGQDGSHYYGGQFNHDFLSAVLQTGMLNDGYGMTFQSTGSDGKTHWFEVTRGLTEFYMGSTLLKVIQVNQDTARMNMGALGSRFDWIHRQFMRPILPPSGLPRTPDEQDPDMPKLLMSQKEKDRASQEAKAIETQAALASPIIHNYSSKVFNRIWLNALGTSERAGFFGEKDVSGREIAGYRYDTGGFILGYDHEHGDATYGGAFSFQHGSYRDLIMDYNNSKLQNYAISFYGTHSSFDEWYLNWIVGYSYANNKLNFGSGGADYKQDFETDTVYAQAMWGSDCWLIDHPTRSLRLTPSFGVGYIRTSSADHTANNTTIKADTHRFDIHRLGTGYLPASLELVFETDTYRGGNFSFSLIGGYQYNFSKKHASGSLTLLGMNGHAATYKTWGRQRRNRHTWNAGARVNYTARRWEVGLSYDFFKRNDSHAHLFNGNFGVFF